MNVQIAASNRKTEAEVDGIFPRRWSPRAMSGAVVTLPDLLPLFEAARWAPSSYNNQPWRFVYALRGTKEFDLHLSLLVENNKAWAKEAGALIVMVSRTVFDQTGRPSRTHGFDCGAAWAYFALHGSMRGLVVHGMEGFDYERAKAELGVPEDFQVEAMCAVGWPGDPEKLPKKARDMERPSGRKSIAEFAFEGRFGAAWA